MASSATRSFAAASSAEKSFDQGRPSRSTVSRAAVISSVETVWTGLCGCARATIASFAFTDVSRLAYVNAMSPARPSATASSTRPAQRERGARRMKSSSIRCMQSPCLNGVPTCAGTTSSRGPLLGGERELAVREGFGAPRVVHLGVEFPLRADDDARHRLREAEERAFALQDLGQNAAPAFVGAAAADRHPHAALDEREGQAAWLLDHDPA